MPAIVNCYAMKDLQMCPGSLGGELNRRAILLGYKLSHFFKSVCELCECSFLVFFFKLCCDLLTLGPIRSLFSSSTYLWEWPISFSVHAGIDWDRKTRSWPPCQAATRLNEYRKLGN